MNTFCGVGNLTKNPTKIKDGVVGFTIAVNSGKDNVDYISGIASKNNADYLMRYAKKGDAISIEGKLSSYDKEIEGKKLTLMSVIAFRVSIVKSIETKPKSK